MATVVVVREVPCCCCCWWVVVGGGGGGGGEQTGGWAQEEQTRELGLKMITMACEEFADTRIQALASRQKELKSLLRQQMPSISGASLPNPLLGRTHMNLLCLKAEWRDQLRHLAQGHLRQIQTELPSDISPLAKSFLSPIRYQGSLDGTSRVIASSILGCILLCPPTAYVCKSDGAFTPSPEGISQAMNRLSPSDVLGSGLFEAVLPLTMLQDDTGAQVTRASPQETFPCSASFFDMQEHTYHGWDGRYTGYWSARRLA